MMRSVESTKHIPSARFANNNAKECSVHGVQYMVFSTWCYINIVRERPLYFEQIK